LRRRRWLTLVAGLLPLLFVGVYAARKDQTIYHARPVSTGHQLWRNDCGKCHKTPWQPLVRLAALDNNARSVRDQDCRQCHVQRSDDHHKVASAASYPDCAACHKEHQGQRRLAEVADEFCLSCHRDLKAQHPGQVSFIDGIESFDSHPPFALHRTWQADPRAAGSAADNLPGEAHAAWSNVEIQSRGGTWQAVDKAKLEFSHKRHLGRHLKRLAAQPAGEDAADEFRKLDCVNCHQPDAAGHFMKPIVYEDHCANCHPLKYSSNLLGSGTDESLPHEKAEIVHGVLRDRLMAFAKNNPQQVSEAVGTTPRLPNKGRAASKDEWAFVEEQLQLIETAVFQKPAAGASPKNNACQKCHQVEPAKHSEGRVSPLSFEITPPEIPQRWLQHSRFRHDRHRELTCVHCHHTSSSEEDALHDGGAAITLESDAVKDVLMPSVQICQQCHGDHGRSAFAGRARSGCIECHQYHHEPVSPGNAGRLLHELMPTDRGGFEAPSE